MRAALSHQQANQLEAAEKLYRQALALSSDEPDCLHMLGVVCLQTGRPQEAIGLILKASVLTGWRFPKMRHNLSLALCDALSENDAYTSVRHIAYRMWCQQRAAGKTMRQPLVSVIIPSYNHEAYIADCLLSVYGQTYRQIELIVIDDGSTDSSPALIKNVLGDCPFPHQFIARENRGAHATINEGIAFATGEFINILNSDDRFSPERIQRMVEEVACSGADWGFANVQIIDGIGIPVKNPAPGSRAADLQKILAEGPRATTIGFGLLSANFAITTGNFFVSRTLFQRLGGFSNLRYNHDWEFALRATRESEPVYVPERLYLYRLHDHNTIAESSIAPKIEADELFRTYFQANDRPTSNPFAPSKTYWGNRYLAEKYRFTCQQTSDHHSIMELAQWISNGEKSTTIPPLSYLSFFEEQPDIGRILDYIANNDFPEAIPFDQAQRYGVTAMAIEWLRRPGQIFTILEVGANRHKILGSLLPQDRIIYLDVEIPEEMKAYSNVIEGDATALAFSDSQFDVIVALDVLEHIPSEKRRDFLWHTTRVARLMTVIAAPFDDPRVRAAEVDACAFWDRLMPKPYRWLTEHADNGLPNLTETRSILTGLGVKHWPIGHGRLKLWNDMLKGHFSAEAMPGLRPVMHALDELYAKNLLAHDFSDIGCYRHFLFCSPSPDEIDNMANYFSSLSKLPPSEDADLCVVQKVLAVMQELALEQGKPWSYED
ncbi:MAG: glycosyltransferase [Thiothrix sp.]|jgi:glycosyltransferase involved in cell wall biosynthesis|uniref:glycosyltransferase n=1 Tax=Thiothrix sp. TaxID=1032 RepID=UPI0026280AD2|nr:glycosyltransferase [Thiothrix sp.]MDD5395626.1 glycosyltransferase [Thiothrix sp.]